MKVRPECFHCVLRVLSKEAKLFNLDGVEFAKRFLKEAAKRVDSITTPADMAYLRESILKDLIGAEDPFKDIKLERIEKVRKEIAPIVEREVNNLPEGYHRFRWLALNAASINGYEVPLHREGPVETFINTVKKGLAIDNTEEAFDILTKVRRGEYIVYILDNAHEFPIDRLLIRYMMSLGKSVYVFARGKPVADDITSKEVLELDPTLEVFSLSSPLGVNPELELETNRRILSNANLIIAKGMANYETLTEYDLGVTILYLLTAKCTPVAEDLGINKGSPVALMR